MTGTVRIWHGNVLNLIGLACSNLEW